MPRTRLARAPSLYRSLLVTMLGAACCVTSWQDVFKQYDDGDGVLSRDELKRMQADRCVVDELMPRRVGMLKAETSKLAEAVSSCGLIASGHLATALVACSLTLTSWTPTETVWFQKTSWRLPWSAPQKNHRQHPVYGAAERGSWVPGGRQDSDSMQDTKDEAGSCALGCCETHWCV